jgi:hypothetical protein
MLWYFSIPRITNIILSTLSFPLRDALFTFVFSGFSGSLPPSPPSPLSPLRSIEAIPTSCHHQRYASVTPLLRYHYGVN